MKMHSWCVQYKCVHKVIHAINITAYFRLRHYLRAGMNSLSLFIYFFLYFYLFILFFNFTILYWFCHISKWIHHRYTCVPHPEPSSLLPPHTIPLGRPIAPAPSIKYCALNLDWRLVSYMILYMFQCFYLSLILRKLYEIENTFYP